MFKKTFAALAVLGAAFAAAPAAANGMQAQCQGVYGGVPFTGVLSVTRVMTARAWEIRGVFTDPARQRYDFEVLTPYDGGTGGLWVNHMRHREQHVHVQLFQGGFDLRLENGQTVRFSCA